MLGIGNHSNYVVMPDSINVKLTPILVVITGKIFLAIISQVNYLQFFPKINLKT
jgi:uncharacterized membrane-anchored protein